MQGPDGGCIAEEEKNKNEKKKRGSGKPTGNRSAKSAAYLHKKLSGIERILGEAKWERHGLHLAAPMEVQLPGGAERTPARAGKEKVLHLPPRSPPSEKQADEHHPIDPPPRIGIRYLQRSAIRIQAAYRGYKVRDQTLRKKFNFFLAEFIVQKSEGRRSYLQARKSFRALLRLHRTMRGPGVMRQTVNAMRLMQLVTRVQSQICQRRAQGMVTPLICEKEEGSGILGQWSSSPRVKDTLCTLPSSA